MFCLGCRGDGSKIRLRNLYSEEICALTTTIALVKIQLVCVNPIVAVGVWVQPEGSDGQP